MKFNQESFDFLEKQNLALKKEIKFSNKFPNNHSLNQSQNIAQIGSWNWDIKNNKVEWSDMMYLLIGLAPSEQLPSYELALHHVHKDDKVDYEQCLLESMNSKKDYYFENRIIKKNLSIINVISKGICICNIENELIGMYGTVQDITSYKNHLETNQQLEHFVNILSHDFKTPIRTIISFIGLIKKKSFKNFTEEEKQYFSFIETGARNLSDLVNEILEFSKLSSPNLNRTKVPIKELIKSILSGLNIALVEKKGSITIGWLPEVITVDKLKIRQVLQNLISNAIKYVSPKIKPEIEIFCEEDDSTFTFYIKDNGIGLNEKVALTIFAPYIRINDAKSFSGNGIGLSICKRIIKLHNGEIGHLTNKEIGSSFYFSIPK